MKLYAHHDSLLTEDPNGEVNGVSWGPPGNRDASWTDSWYISSNTSWVNHHEAHSTRTGKDVKRP